MRLIDLPALFEAHAAVVLFSHWADDAVEFADGLVPGARVVDAVPVSFTGVFDLCVCHPMSLVNRLNELRPNCIVKHSAKPAIPLYWLYFYRMLFGGLRRHPTYVTALDEVVQAILE